MNHKPLVELYQKVADMEGVKHVTIGSGIRYEMLLPHSKEEDLNNGQSKYLHQIVNKHVSGRLKVAPEHTDTEVLKLMRKPEFDKFIEFLDRFNQENKKCGKNQQLIPYLIGSHPGCTVEKMAELSRFTQKLHLLTDQVQDFTPTPMTFSTAMYYLGYNPYDGKKVHIAKSMEERKKQHDFFFKTTKRNRR